MSTLTKVLIVLLTISSIFLCGVVVTYVASADNYKQLYDQRLNSELSAKQQRDKAREDLNAAQEAMAGEKAKLNANIASLQGQITALQGQLRDAETARDDARRRKENYEAILADYSKTVERNTQLQRDALAAEAELKAEQTKLNKQLEDVTGALNEKQAIVMQLESKVKGLIEEKTALQNKLDEFLRQYGKVTAAPVPVTAIGDVARLAPPAKDIDLKGALIAVDLKSGVAEISIGAADGVEKGMRFHATRDSKFICDVVVMDVEPEKALGWLELLQDQPQDKPKTGDAVSTNL